VRRVKNASHPLATTDASQPSFRRHCERSEAIQKMPIGIGLAKTSSLPNLGALTFRHFLFSFSSRGFFMSFDPLEPIGADPVADHIAQLKEIFPEAFTEGRIDFDVLRQLLGAQVEEREEKFGLNWHGKRQARQLALTPSSGTLRPCLADSVDWDSTQNLMIEGDNLEVLKLLQKSYAGKVKLIYIDPPYNTSKDFVYPDNFTDSIKNYLELTGQVEGGKKISSNTDASGRFHTDWLNMMYPRLKLARSLLREDGVLAVSISDAEAHNLRSCLDEAFGKDNFIACVIWNSTKSVTNTALISVSHTHNFLYAKDKKYFVQNRRHFRLPEDGEGFANPDNDLRGLWKADPFQVGGERPNQRYPITNPVTGEVFRPNPGNSWKNEFKVFEELIAESRIVFGVTGEAGPQRKRFLSEAEDRGKVSKTLWDDIDTTTNATMALKELMGASVFSNPKPIALISRFIQLGTHDPSDAIVLDFFGGSGTTGQAVLAQNAIDGGKRKFIVVQLPQPISTEQPEEKIATNFCDSLGKPRTIAELTKERLRRAGAKIKSENPLFTGDVGFRVFKLDTSNIRAWNSAPSALETNLLSQAENLLPGRSEADLLFELLLKVGHDLCAPVAKRAIAGLQVHAVDTGRLFACLAEKITLKQVAPLSQGMIDWHEELGRPEESMIVFRDSAFVDDVVKTNMAESFKQAGLKNLRSL
jgi:adenine-specific DNA-methyltransferase